MTIEQFDATQFHFGMRVQYQGKEYRVLEVDFEERLLGLEFDNETVKTVRCENVEIVLKTVMP